MRSLAARSPRAPADVTIEAPSRTFAYTFPRRRRLLRWSWIQVVRRRFVVSALPMRELIAMNEYLHKLNTEMSGLDLSEMCSVILGTREALEFTPDQAQAIWDWYCEANRIAHPKAEPATAPAASATPSSMSSSTSDAGPSTTPTDGSST